MNIKLVAFDLDGTLLNDNKSVNSVDLHTLNKLGEQKIIRVAATGRNLFSIQRILKPDFPIDYAVFSSGAGIINWKTNTIIEKNHLNQSEIKQVVNLFNQQQLSFTLHSSIPNTHHMFLKLQDSNAADLKKYTSFYNDSINKLDINNLPSEATQLIALINQQRELFQIINHKLHNLKVVLTTSPIDHKSLWIEVFSKKVSKANGIDKIGKILNINQNQTFSIGNDFNDIDMLNYSKQSFVVSNAHIELKEKFKVSLSNNENGFTYALRQVIDI